MNNKDSISSSEQAETESRLQDLLLTTERDLIYSLKGVSVKPIPLDECVLLMHAHCLPSFVILIRVLIKFFHLRPENIFLIPKPYSTIPASLRHLEELGVRIISDDLSYRPGKYDNSQVRTLRRACHAVLRRFSAKSAHLKRFGRVLVVDDGGLITKMWDRYRTRENIPTVSIQHTASGIGPQRGAAGLPKIDVARSAGKKLFEAQIISDAVVRKVASMGFDLDKAVVGIVGLGSIGESLAKALKVDSNRLIALEQSSFSKNTSVRSITNSASDFLRRCDVIFGCSGKNWSKVISKPSLTGQKFISCSSRDVEFKHLLELYSDGQLRRDFRRIKLDPNGNSAVCNAGFPINFDRKKEWESFEEIGLTRLLILYGIVVSTFVDTNKFYDETIMLPVTLQMRMVSDWLTTTEYSPTDFGVSISNFKNDQFWRLLSGGRSILD